MSTMNVGSKLRWSTASNITSWHHLHSTVTQKCHNLTQLKPCNTVRVPLYAYVPHRKVLNNLYMSNMNVGRKLKLRWSTASTMTSWHHFHSTVTQKCPNLTQLQRCKGVMVHLYAYIPHWKVLRVMLVVPLLNSSICYFSFTLSRTKHKWIHLY